MVSNKVSGVQHFFKNHILITVKILIINSIYNKLTSGVSMPMGCHPNLAEKICCENHLL